MTTAADTLTAGKDQPNGAGGAGANGGLPPNPPAAGWWDSVKDPEVKGWLANKKYGDAETALKSYWSLERLMGAEKAGRTVMLPKDENDAEGYKALAKGLGVPDTADGYKLPMPEAGGDEAFMKTAASWFHEAGIPPRAANMIADKWNGFIAEQIKATDAAERAESDKQMAGLEKEWGPKFSEQRELAQRGYREFAKQFGLDDKAALDRAESVFGAANLTKFFAGLGSLNGESTFAGADGKGGFKLSAQDAQAQIDTMIADRTAGKYNDFQWRTEIEPKILKLAEVVARVAA